MKVSKKLKVSNSRKEHQTHENDGTGAPGTR